jgi:hypothetical protein
VTCPFGRSGGHQKPTSVTRGRPFHVAPESWPVRIVPESPIGAYTGLSRYRSCGSCLLARSAARECRAFRTTATRRSSSSRGRSRRSGFRRRSSSAATVEDSFTNAASASAVSRRSAASCPYRKVDPATEQRSQSGRALVRVRRPRSIGGNITSTVNLEVRLKRQPQSVSSN